MGKTAVIYKSKSGFTKKYAEWIAEKTGGDLICGKASLAELKNYDVIIYGGGLYAGKVNGVSLITKNYEQLKDKKLIVFCVCLSSLTRKVKDSVRIGNIPDGAKIDFFMMRGGFDMSKCTFIDRMVMHLMKRAMSAHKDHSPDEKGMLEAFEHPVDFTDIRNIRSIVDCAGK